MSYPGSADLEQKVQQRILTAFAESVRLFREGHQEECRTILRSILEVDPKFSPAQRLEDAIVRGAQVDLAQLLGAVAATAPINVEATLARARDAIATRDFQGALVLAQSVLRELPGHAEARAVALETQARTRAAGEVESHLARAEEALAAGMLDEATGFVKMALAADPSHPKLAALSRRLEEAAAATEPSAEAEFAFETFTDDSGGDAGTEPPAGPSKASHHHAFAGSPDAAVPAVVSTPTSTGRPPEPSPAPPPVAFARPAPSSPPSPPVAAATPPPVAATPPPAAPAPSADATPPTSAPTPQAAGAAAGAATPVPLFTFDEATEEVEFGAAAEFEFSPTQGEAASDESTAKVDDLLERGQQAFDQGDYQSAIDSWSRIYLIDAQNSEAERRIEQARRRSEEHQRLAEHRFYEAREAFEAGRREEARELCQEVLRLVPQHLEAHDLLGRLDTPAAPPPPPAEAPDEVDLFKDDFVPATLTSSGESPAVGAPATPRLPMERPVVKPSRREAGPGKRLPVSIPLLAGIGGMVVVLVLLGLVLRGTIFSGDAAAIAAALAEAEKLAGEGKLQEAVTLLQNTEAEGEEANQLNQKALEYTRRLRAQNRPAPASSAADVHKALSEGKWLRASRLARDGLANVPGDRDLLRVQEELRTFSSAIEPLTDAVAAGRWDSARMYAARVLERHPQDPDADRIWRVATFNAAVVALRNYQVATAQRLLQELARKGDDPEVKRLAELSGSYLSRPVDPRYQIFVGSIELRSAD